MRVPGIILKKIHKKKTVMRQGRYKIIPYEVIVMPNREKNMPGSPSIPKYEDKNGNVPPSKLPPPPAPPKKK